MDGKTFLFACCLSFLSFCSHYLRTASSVDQLRNFLLNSTSSSIYNYILVNTVFQGKLTNRFPSFLSSSSLPLWPLPPGSNSASGLLLPSSLSLLLRWLGGLQGPGSSLPASPSPPASGESLPPARQQQSCLAGSLCLCQPLVSGGAFIDAVKAYVPPWISWICKVQ